ncbi:MULTISPECIES: RrF2 family transcriptional regulator [Bacillaceae]|uniref:RrF2 family transcriptional regulator n=1 Tax=Bacillaceae TaxID=186817 RepID=UPI000C790F26|nr:MULTISPECIES: Rrf2 family transcriptional regulator [Bacillaceae]PLR66904.1 Rrf2 family transcriptional regulator [Bacillus sp. UMB0893]QNG61592.1 Rrf2 family transcriptional regulator [Bacillus sp. PAMC26568]
MAEKISSTGWFGMALQALIILADYEGLCPSGKIAEKLESQSAFLRKILTHLVKAGLIQAKEGRDGGYSLVKDPGDITLAEVYDAMKAEPFTKGFLCIESKECFDSTTRTALFELRNEMESWIVDGLKQKTIADLLMK